MAVMKCFDLAGTWVVDPILIGRVNTNAAGLISSGIAIKIDNIYINTLPESSILNINSI